jgi:hypothetical protein
MRRLLTQAPDASSRSLANYAYVGSGNSTRFAVVDIRTGRVVGLARTTKPTVVLAP